MKWLDTLRDKVNITASTDIFVTEKIGDLRVEKIQSLTGNVRNGLGFAAIP